MRVFPSGSGSQGSWGLCWAPMRGLRSDLFLGPRPTKEPSGEGQGRGHGKRQDGRVDLQGTSRLASCSGGPPPLPPVRTWAWGAAAGLGLQFSTEPLGGSRGLGQVLRGRQRCGTSLGTQVSHGSPPQTCHLPHQLLQEDPGLQRWPALPGSTPSPPLAVSPSSSSFPSSCPTSGLQVTCQESGPRASQRRRALVPCSGAAASETWGRLRGTAGGLCPHLRLWEACAHPA